MTNRIITTSTRLLISVMVVYLTYTIIKYTHPIGLKILSLVVLLNVGLVYLPIKKKWLTKIGIITAFLAFAVLGIATPYVEKISLTLNGLEKRTTFRLAINLSSDSHYVSSVKYQTYVYQPTQDSTIVIPLPGKHVKADKLDITLHPADSTNIVIKRIDLKANLLGFPYTINSLTGIKLSSHIGHNDSLKSNNENNNPSITNAGIAVANQFSIVSWDELLGNLDRRQVFTFKLLLNLFTLICIAIISIIARNCRTCIQWLKHHLHSGTTISYFLVEQQTGNNTVTKNRTLILISWITLIGVVIIRSHEYLSQVDLPVEDTILYFFKFYDFSFNSEIFFAKPNHYYTLPTNLIAATTSTLPVKIQPWIYTVLAIFFTSLACVIILASGLFKRKSFFLLVPMVLGLLAVNHIYFWTTLTYLIYILPLIAMLSLFVHPNNTKPNPIIYLIVMFFLIWSGPYSVLILPLSVYLFIMHTNYHTRIRLISAFVITFSYYLTIDTTSEISQFVKDPSRMKEFLDALVLQVMLFNAIDIKPEVAIVIIITLIMTLYSLLYKNNAYILYSTVFLMMMIVALLLYFCSIKRYNPLVSAYLFISLFFWCLFLIYSIHELLDKYQVSLTIDTLVGVLMISLIVKLNIIQPDRWQHTGQPQVAEYLNDITYFEDQNLESKNQYLIIENPTRYHGVAFGGKARIGSKKEDASQLFPRDIPDQERSKFVSPIQDEVM